MIRGFEANITNVFLIQEIEEKYFEVDELVAYPNSEDIIFGLKRISSILYSFLMEATSSIEEWKPTITEKAVNIFVEWDTSAFSKTIENPSINKVIFRKLLLTIIFRIASLTSTEFTNGLITEKCMSDALNQTEYYLKLKEYIK